MKSADANSCGDIRKILEITRLMAATNDLNQLFKLVVERSMELLDAERGSLFLYEPQTAELYNHIAAGEKEIRCPRRSWHRRGHDPDRRMERATKLARDIQRNLLPERPPRIAGFDIASFSEAVDDTGGEA